MQDDIKLSYTFNNNVGVGEHTLLQDDWKLKNSSYVTLDYSLRSLISVSKADIFNYFRSLIPNARYLVSGKHATVMTEHFFIQLAWVNPSSDYSSMVKSFYLHIYTHTLEENMDKFQQFLDKFPQITKVAPKVSADWYYVQTNGDLNYVRLGINVPPKFHPELYPFIPNVDQYIADFLNSSSNVLIFTGDPGLGKSSLIKHIIANFEQEAIIAYDQEVMKMDRLYLDFLESEASLLVLEDADLLLSSRKEAQNAVMSKILNVSDGILSSVNKKFIFTANIKNTSDIDPALIRPGRCYDVKMFRPLTQEEAIIASKALGRDLPEKRSEYTLAEIFNRKVSTELQSSIGFGFGG